MARASKLKLFRTAIGFHDAYVAASSRAAALRAWGSDKDLFARGAAEEVDVGAEPAALEVPGTVVKRLRATAAEQIAALPPDRPARTRAAAADAPERQSRPRAHQRKAHATPARPRARPPHPSRAALEEAERALSAARTTHRQDQATLRAEEQALARRRQALAAAQEAEETRLEQACAAADRAYREALARWHGSGD